MSSISEIPRRKFLKIAAGAASLVLPPALSSCGPEEQPPIEKQNEAKLEELGLTGTHRIVGIEPVGLPDQYKGTRYHIKFEKDKIDSSKREEKILELYLYFANINMQKAGDEETTTIEFSNWNLNDVDSSYGIQQLVDWQTDRPDSFRQVVTINISPKDISSIFHNPCTPTK